MKRIKSSKIHTKEIFPKPSPATIPISNVYEEIMLLFDELEKAITYEAKAVDNKVDELKKIIDDTAKDMHHQSSTVDIPQVTNTTF